MKHLIPMTEFVIRENDNWEKETELMTHFNNVVRYAEFLKQKPELYQFVPCDDNNVPLVEPKGTDLENSFFEMQVDYNDERLYEAAKSRVLFEGFYIDSSRTQTRLDLITNGEIPIAYFDPSGQWFIKGNIDTIEDLAPYNLTLSETSLKLINSK